MPPTNADDPFRTTDHARSQTPLGREVTAEFPQDPPGANEGTEPMGVEPEPAREAVSMPGYQIEGVLGRDEVRFTAARMVVPPKR